MTTEVTAIRDAIFALLQTLPGYTKVRKTPVRQLGLADCPALTVVMGEDDAVADEDATAGPPHFVHSATYHVSVLRGLDDPDTLDGKIDADLDTIQNLLLRNVALNQMIEGVTAMRRSRAFPQDGETYFVELRFDLTVQIRSTWNPVIPDDLTGMDITSLPVGARTDPPTEPLHLEIDVETQP
jgi:hypothetical protein